MGEQHDRLETKVERLKAEASERWGDRWVVKTSHFADGDTRAHAIRSHGRNDDGNLVKDHLFILDTGEIAVERVTLQRREIENKTVEAPATTA